MKLKLILKYKKKRRNFPKLVVDFLREWFHNNIHYPYPSDNLKNIFSDCTGLTKKQITNFFITERKRNKNYKLYKLYHYPSHNTKIHFRLK